MAGREIALHLNIVAVQAGAVPYRALFFFRVKMGAVLTSKSDVLCHKIPRIDAV